ncbi:hypothetical protein ACFVYD_25840 [Streptomyces sp. NPDC058301]|uniref:hypothetical protein n=1 Tax=Streptomyces sp. NPDC058301 TaxID=3346436 RepID=UPI0036F03258
MRDRAVGAARSASLPDKTRLDVAAYQGRHQEAAERARKLDPTGADHLLNPSTGVWCLTDRMTKR